MNITAGMGHIILGTMYANVCFLLNFFFFYFKVTSKHRDLTCELKPNWFYLKVQDTQHITENSDFYMMNFKNIRKSIMYWIRV